MHEVSIIGDLFDSIEDIIQQHKLNHIKKVVLKIGVFTCVEEDSLRFAFQGYAKDTIAENAAFIIEKVQAAAYCSLCCKEFPITFTNKVCPDCKTFSNTIIAGNELILEHIEGE